jgi:hypothetical protein
MTEKAVYPEENRLYRGLENLPADLWEDLLRRNPVDAAQRAAVIFNPDDGYHIPFLGIDHIVNAEKRAITIPEKTVRAGFQVGLVLLNYLIHASNDGIAGKMVGARELNGGELFFKGPHALSTEPILERFAGNGRELLSRADKMGANPKPGGDVAFSLWPLPKIMIEYTLYEEDDEFPAGLSITFDAYTDRHLPLDCIWALVNVITHRLARD